MRLREARLIGLLLLLLAPAARGQYVLEDAHDPKRYGPSFLALPLGFYTPNYRYAVGLVGDATGLIQPQEDLFAFGLGSTSGTYQFLLGQTDLQLKPINRLFLDTENAFFQEQRYSAYVNGNPHYLGTAGSNSSSPKDFFITQSDDGWGSFTFKYLLPIGDGRDNVIDHYVLEDGFLQSGASGGYGWNPLSTGRTFVQVAPFYEYQTLETPAGDLHLDTNGARFGLVYDNTNFALNPSSGNVSKVTVSRDFGLFNSSSPWTTVSGEFTQYVDLGRNSLFRQQVLVLDGWTRYAITWDRDVVGGRYTATHGPPFYESASLGGDTRLRGFPENRFHDRAAIYGAAELRLIPTWNPFRQIKLLEKADITWMQWVVFGEVGRVAPEYTGDIFSHLKGDVGFGLRILANDTLIRLDVAESAEGFSFSVQLGEPF